MTVSKALGTLKLILSLILDVIAWVFLEIGNGLSKASAWLIKGAK